MDKTYIRARREKERVRAIGSENTFASRARASECVVARFSQFCRGRLRSRVELVVVSTSLARGFLSSFLFEGGVFRLEVRLVDEFFADAGF